MIEQSLEDVADGMKSAPKSWAKMYLALQQETARLEEVIDQQRIIIATFEKAALNDTH